PSAVSGGVSAPRLRYRRYLHRAHVTHTSSPPATRRQWARVDLDHAMRNAHAVGDELLGERRRRAAVLQPVLVAVPRAGRAAVDVVEAAEQLKRALDLIATLPGSPARRREEIKLQVALITPLLHVSGYATPETRAAVERARLLIEQAEALGEPPE